MTKKESRYEDDEKISIHRTRQSDDSRHVHIIDKETGDTGHIVYDKDGDVTYIRMPNTPHDDSQYDDKRDTPPTKDSPPQRNK
jgi:hypothetical protein